MISFWIFPRPSSPFSHPFSHFFHLASPFSLPSFPLFSFLPPLVSFLPVSLFTPSSHNRRTDRTEKNNIQVHSATSYLIFQYLQYWYNQYFPVSSSICNTGITSIFQNLPVSVILVLPVFPRILQYLQYWYYQYFPESSGIYNPHSLPMISIF